MTIPEACQLILHSVDLGANPWSVYALDMGRPVAIRELAEQMIRLSGKRPGIDIAVSYTGLRPGEKLHEMMISADDSRRTRDMGDYYVVEPEFPWWDNGHMTEGASMPDGFSYCSDTNTDKLDARRVRELLGSLDLL